MHRLQLFYSLKTIPNRLSRLYHSLTILFIAFNINSQSSSDLTSRLRYDMVDYFLLFMKHFQAWWLPRCHIALVFFYLPRGPFLVFCYFPLAFLIFKCWRRQTQRPVLHSLPW